MAKTMKRTFDISLSFLLIILCIIPFIIVFVLVKLTSKGPALYWSERVGKNNIIFKMPKFRSMKLDTPQLATHLMAKEDNFLTPIGSLLRKSSLDEMPQLYSIVIGDMSFVGPRPALYNQYDLIELRKQTHVDSLIPGLTGWAQVNGRDELSIEEKVSYDEEYLHRKSFLLDIKIIYLTFINILIARDVSH